MPFLAGGKRLAVRAVKGAGVCVHWSEAEALDGRSGWSRRSISVGRAKREKGYIRREKLRRILRFVIAP
jgi:hypothetical protein